MSTHSFVSNLALVVHRKDGTQKKEQKKVSEAMEKFISEAASQKGFVTSDKRKYKYMRDDEQFSGEVDAILCDGKKVLAIEFKRSALRATNAAISYEREFVLEEAARQLKRFEQYARYNPEDLKQKLYGKQDVQINFSDIPVEGLIITTNFEHDHELISGKYMKVSWIEWLWVIHHIDKDAGIDELLKKIKENQYWSQVLVA
jgi:hypothetical protein